MKVFRTAITRFIARLTLIALALFSSIFSFSQPPGGPPPGGGGTTGTTPPCWEPECIPIDGGLMFLVTGGLLLGAGLLYTQKKQTKA
ncbi:MAG: hypothetical protein ACPG21_11600 [Crocinitomicaceae bacterium]